MTNDLMNERNKYGLPTERTRNIQKERNYERRTYIKNPTTNKALTK